MKKGLLKGLARGWFHIYKKEESFKERCIQGRKKGHCGILIDEDHWALQYQIAHYRSLRAQFSLTGQQILSVWTPGMSKEESEEAALEETLRVFIREPREKAIKAMKLLEKKEY